MKKHIYIYSPAGAVRDKAAFRRGIARLEALGHEVEVDLDALTSYQRFAGDDLTRLSAIHRAAASGADVALISRGGYGLTRLLPDIRYKQVAKAVEKGMAFVGISDFTAFQCAALAKTGAVTWAGPALCEGFGVGAKSGTVASGAVSGLPKPDEIMEACFDDLLQGQGEGTGWRQHLEKSRNTIESGATITYKSRAKGTFFIKNAVLWGGNLTVLTSLLGTPFFPAIKAGVLFLEDVGEHPYRVERMLTQWLHAGVLQQQKALLLGQFTGFKLTSHDRGFNMQAVIDWLRQHTKVPVVTNLPFGHVQTKVLLPVGAKVELAVDGRDALLAWGHLDHQLAKLA
jgi:muramoyltetrapeptide carboxypeptidase